MKGLYDISPVVSERTAVFPGDTPLRRRRLMSFGGGQALELSTLETTVHLGAHADAPCHYHPEGVGISERDPLLYVGVAQVIRVDLPRGERIFPDHLTQSLKGSPIRAPRVLLATRSFPDPDRWNGDFNSLSPELVRWLASHGVRLVGIDTPSVDPADDRVLLSHQAIQACDLAILEGLVLEGVPEGIYTLIAPPLRLEGADASPVRALLLSSPAILEGFRQIEGGA